MSRCKITMREDNVQLDRFPGSTIYLAPDFVEVVKRVNGDGSVRVRLTFDCDFDCTVDCTEFSERVDFVEE